MVLLTEQREGLSDVKDRRLILFAIFFDAKKTVAQGRKVPASLAVEMPILKDVAECLHLLQLPWEFQARADVAHTCARARGRDAPGRAWLTRAVVGCWARQDKKYSRDAIWQRGRLRVAIRNEEDVPINPQILNRARAAARRGAAPHAATQP